MTRSLLAAMGSVLSVATVTFAVEPVTTDVAEGDYWTGQRVPVFVEVRAPGPFSGATSFSIPVVPRSVLLKIGSPVVSTEDVGDDQWFVQRHEFAFFSQQVGVITIPPFEVRYASQNGFTGPSIDRSETVPATEVALARPPGTESIPFLVTTAALSVSESWDPPPGQASVGDVFKRTIDVEAADVTGMALPPFPTIDGEGLRRYPSEPTIADQIERGDFIGRRSETITYVVTSPGEVSLPAVGYQWWNPKTEQVETKTLPAITWDVAAPPVASAAEPSATPTAWRWVWVLALLLLIVGWSVRRRAAAMAKWFSAWINDPERTAARQLLRACSRNDAVMASNAWGRWSERVSCDLSMLPDDISAEVIELQHAVYGPEVSAAWSGAQMAVAFRRYRSTLSDDQEVRQRGSLPALNPFGSSQPNAIQR